MKPSTAATDGEAMIGWAFRQLVIWGGLGLLLYAVAGDRLTPLFSQKATMVDAGATAATSGSSRPAAAMPNSLTFHANRQGHVELTGVVNGAPVQFLVDTGATVVALTLRDAEAAGIRRNDLDYRMHFRTANGIVRAAPVTLRELRINQLVVYDVPAVVQENLFGSLLGQSFLTRLDSYEMRDGVLTLNYW